MDPNDIDGAGAPADTIETFECWQLALKHKKTPSIIALTRQKVAGAFRRVVRWIRLRFVSFSGPGQTERARRDSTRARLGGARARPREGL